MKNVYILATCDKWHSFNSMYYIGAFTTKTKAIQFAMADAHGSEEGEIDSDDIVLLKTISQTQNRSENYKIEEHFY
jgi:regulator of PEP synthase PpsR (kinase-PPPase family)